MVFIHTLFVTYMNTPRKRLQERKTSMGKTDKEKNATPVDAESEQPESSKQATPAKQILKQPKPKKPRPRSPTGEMKPRVRRKV